MKKANQKSNKLYPLKILVYFSSLSILLFSCNNHDTEKYRENKIFDNVKLYLPPHFRIVQENHIRIKALSDNDSKWNDSLFFNTDDSCFIYVEKFPVNRFHARIFKTPMGLSDTLQKMYFGIDTACRVKSVIFISNVDSSNLYSFKEINFSCIIWCTIFIKNETSLSFSFYYSKTQNQTISEQSKQALRILDELKIGNQSICELRNIKFVDASKFTNLTWMEYIEKITASLNK